MSIERLYVKYRENEWFYQIMVLIISALFWHAAYVGLIRPAAQTVLEVKQLQGQASKEITDKQIDDSKLEINTGGKIAVVLKDYEQEACFIAAFWAFFIMLFKWGEIKNTRSLFKISSHHGQDNFLGTKAGEVILPDLEDMQKYRSILERMEQKGYGNNALFRVTLSCLNRFFTTLGIADATSAMEQACVIESERLETGLSIVRYLVWVIPSLGFIGTVRGIGSALGKAEEAIQGNIAPVTESLGTAFNSTLVALAISIVIMFFLHKLQESQETLMLDIQRFCNDNVLRYMQEKKIKSFM